MLCWIQFESQQIEVFLIFLGQTLHAICEVQHDSFSKRRHKFLLPAGFYIQLHASLQLSSFNRGPHLNFFIVPFLQVSCFRKTKARKTARLKISVSRPLMSWFARSSKNCDFSNFSKFLEKSQTVCRNRSFCWAPLYLLILAKSAISPIFRNFWRNRSFCWTTFYLLYHLT